MSLAEDLSVRYGVTDRLMGENRISIPTYDKRRFTYALQVKSGITSAFMWEVREGRTACESKMGKEGVSS